MKWKLWWWPYIVGKGFLTPLHCLSPFLRVWQSPLPHTSFKPSLLFVFFDWKGDYETSDVSFYLMTLWIYRCRTLVPYYQKYHVVCFTQQGVSLLKSNTCRGFLLVLCFDIKNTQTHDTHTWANRLTHSYKHILTPPIMCPQQLSVLHWMNNSQCPYWLVDDRYLLLIFSKTRFFPWNTRNADRYRANKSHHSSAKDKTGNGNLVLK